MKVNEIIVLFKKFLSAETCQNYLSEDANYKDKMKEFCKVSWFNIEEHGYLLSENEKQKFVNIFNINSDIMQQNKVLFEQPENVNINYMLKNSVNINNNCININNSINNNLNNMFGQIQPNMIYNIFPNQNYNNQNNFYTNNNIQINNRMIFQNNNQNILINNSNIFNTGNNSNIIVNMNQNTNIINMNKNNIYLNYNTMPQMNYYQNKSMQMLNQNNKIVEEKGKFTCKYKILISNDNNFNIVKKIIGNKGYNMKRIIDIYIANVHCEPNALKLRLRGKGSGYKEGPGNEECDEDLHLCISCKTQNGLNYACYLVEELINSIYEEYKVFSYI